MSAAPLLQAAEEVLVQGRELLASLDGESYSRKSGGVFAASVGEHYRHVLDHFHCLLEGLTRESVDYDRRQRQKRLEVDRDYALAMTEFMLHELWQIPHPVFEQEIAVTYSVGYHGSRAETMTSTVARELAFCIGHAVHHYAIIRMLCAEMGAQLMPEFGIAPSTVKHHMSVEQ